MKDGNDTHTKIHFILDLHFILCEFSICWQFA